MLLLAYLVACQCNPPSGGTDDSYQAPQDKKYTPYYDSGGGDDTDETGTFVPCRGTLACWRFESASNQRVVADLSGSGNAITLVGQATIVTDAPVLPGSLENEGALLLAAEGDGASVELTGSNLAPIDAGLTVELLVQPDAEVDPVGPEGRTRQLLWIDDGAFSLALEEFPDSSRALVARVDGGGADCQVEAVAPFARGAGSTSCVSVTYGDGELTVFVDGSELPGSRSVSSACASPSTIAVNPAGTLLLGQQPNAESDETWRGLIDEVRLRAGATSPESLPCARGASR